MIIVNQCLDSFFGGTKTNQNENFSKMEEIYRTRISQKGGKCTNPELPQDPAKRKETQNCTLLNLRFQKSH